MRIVVPVKQVPDTTDVRIDASKGTLVREGVPSILNPDDKHALEEALRLKETAGGEVIVISMGPPQAEEVLREALAMGADRAILLSDQAFAGADTLATAYTLSRALRHLGQFDLIMCGLQAIDGDTAQVGPQLAEFLDIPQVTYARKIELDKGKLTVERRVEQGVEVLECQLPALVTAIAELNDPRFPRVSGVLEAFQKDVEVWGSDTLETEDIRIGLIGSPTRVVKTFSPQRPEHTEPVKGPPKELANRVVAALKERNVLR
ncbi:MAG: electron transfer flavoprotein subunit beta/FixA family protein [bacterium]|jgi:electron transfer flavoprotein beta subunit|nr:electron transfer flavoprotein subunit beta/FixA family protein [bacterium]